MKWMAAVLITVGVVVAGLAWTKGAPYHGAPSSNTMTAAGSLNSQILAEVQKYPRGHVIKMTPSAKRATSMGVTRDIYYLGKRVIKADLPGYAYCVGLVFEVWMRAYENASAAKGKPFTLPTIEADSFRNFRRDFYGVSGDRTTFVGALAARGLGTPITDISMAQRGDLVQFWRNNGSGHSAVLVSAEYTFEGTLRRINYWSIQGATGLDYNSELVGEGGSQIDAKQIYILRAHAP